MPRFFNGDELGNVKSFKYALSSTAESEATITTLYDGSGKGKECAVQKFAIHTSGDAPIVCYQPARALPHTHLLTGSWSKVSCHACRQFCFCLQSTCARSGHDTRVDRTSSKTCPKIRWSSRIIRVRLFFFLFLPRNRGQFSNQSSRGVYSCTSNGALRITPLSSDVDAEPSRTAVLPMRLYSWRLAPDGTTFSYGGDEVELSVWDIEAAFAPKLQPPPAITGTESPQQQEAQTQHRATPSRRIVASEKCMFQ